MIYHLTPIRMAVIYVLEKNKTYCGEDAEKPNSSVLHGAATMETSMVVPPIIKTVITI